MSDNAVKDGLSSDESKDKEFDILDLMDSDELPAGLEDNKSDEGDKGDEDDVKGEGEPDKVDKEPKVDEDPKDEKVPDKDDKGEPIKKEGADEADKDKSAEELKKEVTKEEPKKGEEDKKSEEPDAEARLKLSEERNLTLLDEMSKLAGKVASSKGPVVPAVAVTPVAQKVEVPEAKKPEVKPKLEISDDDYSNAMESKEGFLDFIGKVIADAAVPEPPVKAPADVSVDITAAGTVSMSDVEELISQRLNTQRLETEFYQANPDLAKYKPLVDVTASDVRSSGSYNTTGEFFDAVEVEVRKRYGLQKQAARIVDTKDTKDSEEESKNTPAFAKAGQGSRRVKEEQSDELREMLELMDDD